jgi:hypothetical protein
MCGRALEPEKRKTTFPERTPLVAGEAHGVPRIVRAIVQPEVLGKADAAEKDEPEQQRKAAADQAL